jgi:hypothetical protein
MANEANLPASFAEQLQGKLQTTIGDMIPAAAYEAIVQSNIDIYVTKTLPNLVNKALEDYFKNQIAEELRKPEWLNRYSTNGSGNILASSIVAKIISEHSDKIMAGMIGGIVQSMMANAPYTPRMY